MTDEDTKLLNQTALLKNLKGTIERIESGELTLTSWRFECSATIMNFEISTVEVHNMGERRLEETNDD